MDEDDREYLDDMLRYAETVSSLLGSADLDQLSADLQMSLAVARAMQIIGEAANRISLSARQQIPAIPWEEVIGMRHRLVHDYRNARLQVLFDTVKQDIPALVADLRRALGRSGE